MDSDPKEEMDYKELSEDCNKNLKKIISQLLDEHVSNIMMGTHKFVAQQGQQLRENMEAAYVAGAKAQEQQVGFDAEQTESAARKFTKAYIVASKGYN